MGHVASGSTKAKSSKSKSIPSNLLLTTKFVIVLTMLALAAGSASKLERIIGVCLPVTGFVFVPSVIVGRILYPALCSCEIGPAMGTLGFAGV